MSRLKDFTKALKPAKPMAKAFLKSALRAIDVSKEGILEAQAQLIDLITEVRADMANTKKKVSKKKPAEKKSQRRRPRTRA
jgi:septal ring factor EnvC (AmiA/AmiB activator)